MILGPSSAQDWGCYRETPPPLPPSTSCLLMDSNPRYLHLSLYGLSYLAPLFISIIIIIIIILLLIIIIIIIIRCLASCLSKLLDPCLVVDSIDFAFSISIHAARLSFGPSPANCFDPYPILLKQAVKCLRQNPFSVFLWLTK